MNIFQDQQAAMTLSPEERTWAKQLARNVQVNGPTLGISPVSDMNYAQHVIIARGDLDQALWRMKGLQEFRRVYNVQDSLSPEDALVWVERFVRDQPGVLMHLDVDLNNGEGVTAWNYAAFHPQRGLETEANWKVHILFSYYIFLALHPTFQAIRQGGILLLEGQGMSWGNFDMTYETRQQEELFQHMPIKFQQIRVYNSNTIVNLFMSLMKPLLKPFGRIDVQMGCRVEEELGDAHLSSTATRTLGELYLNPNYDVAMHNMLQRAKRLFQLRYHNEKVFRL